MLSLIDWQHDHIDTGPECLLIATAHTGCASRHGRASSHAGGKTRLQQLSRERPAAVKGIITPIF